MINTTTQNNNNNNDLTRLLVVFGNNPQPHDYLYSIVDDLEKEWRQTTPIPTNHIKKITVTQDNFSSLHDRIYALLSDSHETVEIYLAAHNVLLNEESTGKIGYAKGLVNVTFEISQVANCFITAIKQLEIHRLHNINVKFTLGVCNATKPGKNDLTLSHQNSPLNQSIAAKFLSAFAAANICTSATGYTGEIVPLHTNNQLVAGVKDQYFRVKRPKHQLFTYFNTKEINGMLYWVYPADVKENEWIYQAFDFVNKMIRYYYSGSITFKKLVCLRNQLINCKDTLTIRNLITTIPQFCQLKSDMSLTFSELLNSFTVESVTTFERAHLGQCHPLYKSYHRYSLWPALISDPKFIYDSMDLTEENNLQKASLNVTAALIQTHFNTIESHAKKSLGNYKKSLSVTQSKREFILNKKMTEAEVLAILFVINYKKLLPNFIGQYPQFSGAAFRDFFELDYNHTFRRLFMDTNNPQFSYHLENAEIVDFSITKSFFSTNYDVKCLFSYIAEDNRQQQ